jgi:hypothetical protein
MMKKINRNRNWDQEERKEKEESCSSRASIGTCQQKQNTIDTFTKWGYEWQVWWIL